MSVWLQTRNSSHFFYSLIIFAIYGIIAHYGIKGYCTWFTDGSNGISDNLLCTSGLTVRNNNPRFTLPLLEYTDSDFVLSFKCTSYVVS